MTNGKTNVRETTRTINTGQRIQPSMFLLEEPTELRGTEIEEEEEEKRRKRTEELVGEVEEEFEEETGRSAGEEMAKALEEARLRHDALEGQEQLIDDAETDNDLDELQQKTDFLAERRTEALDDFLDAKDIENADKARKKVDLIATDIEKKDSLLKSALERSLEQKKKELRNIKIREEIEKVEDEIQETRAQLNRPGFFGTAFGTQRKSVHDLERENSRLEAELKISDIEDQITKKEQIIRERKSHRGARGVVGKAKETFIEEFWKPATAKRDPEAKAGPVSSFLGDFLSPPRRN